MRTACLALLVLVPSVRAAEYDPLRTPDGFELRTVELKVRDAKRDREIPLLVYLPAEKKPAAVVLFSHGLGGSRNGCAYLGKHWSARGYVAIFVQHPGSDEAVWRDAPLLQRMNALRGAASAANFLLRVQDVPAVLDQLGKWNGEKGHALEGRVDLERVGISGHSFGAVTTQAVSGQAQARRARFTDDRIRAAIAFSPSTPKVGNPQAAFGSVKVPWLLMTGTRDTSPIGGQTVESRQDVFPALPPGSKYEVLLDGAEHSAFAESRLPGERGRRNPNHHRATLAISTAFWDAHVLGDAAARRWLDGDGPETVLEKADRWQTK